MSFGARALIRLGALRHNFRRIRDIAGGANVMAVVKANAYGHGLVEVAMGLPDADAFAVARIGEAIELESAGVRKPILILGGAGDAAECRLALARGFELVVHCEPQIEWLESASVAKGVVWLKLDTGMHRLGFEPGAAASLIARMRDCRAVRELRLMTHLASADDRDDKTTAAQINAFRELLHSFDGHISVANSPGLFGWPEAITAGHDASRSWVRAGLCLYGVSPFAGNRGSDLGLRPVMQFESRLMAVKPIRAGARVGYCGRWQAPGDTVLGIVSAGYGDGYLRFLPSGTPVLVSDRRVALAGLISMDMAAVDLGAGATDKVGAPVTLWGPALPVEEIAEHAGTVPYQLLAGLTHREKRETVDEDG